MPLVPFLALAIWLLLPQVAAAQTGGFVYVATNQGTGNTVIQYSRAANGALTRLHQIATGGLGGAGNGVGSLDPLGSQDSLVLNDAGSLLLVVNAGSNQVSSIAITRAGLQLRSTVGSGGIFPNSIAVRGNLVYVLNARGAPDVAGFRLDVNGALAAIPNSVRSLPGGIFATPHDIRFSPDGTKLLVTEGGTNLIDVFFLDNNGSVMGAITQNSAGSGPFGFRFELNNVLINAEANTASVTSYFLTPQNNLTVINAAVGDGQAAPSHLTLSGDGTAAFISNTLNGTLSSYQVGPNGGLTLVRPVAAFLGGGAPIDSALSGDSAFLYVLDSALGRIVAYRVQGATLSPLGAIAGLPMTLQGIAAQ